MTVEELVAEVTELKQQFAALLNETQDDRAKREQRAWEAQRAREARDAAIRQKTSRLADLDDRIADVEPWAKCLTTIRKEVEAELAALLKTVTKGQDAENWKRLQDVEYLRDTVQSIDGARDWRVCGDLHERVVARKLPLTNGRRHPMQERLMLPRTKQLLAEFKKEREKVQEELDALLKDVE